MRKVFRMQIQFRKTNNNVVLFTLSKNRQQKQHVIQV